MLVKREEMDCESKRLQVEVERSGARAKRRMD